MRKEECTMALEDEIKKKELILRQQLDEEERKRKLEEAWKNFNKIYNMNESTPIIVETPVELQSVLQEINSKINFKNLKLTKTAPDGTIRVRRCLANDYTIKSFDIVLASSGSGKDLRTLEIWIFSLNKVALVCSHRCTTWSQLKEEGITSDIVRDKAIETIAMQNIKRGSSSNSGHCYIATAVYGSYDCPEVWVLRRFRDEKLLQSFCGRLFVKCYYAFSPSLVALFSEKKWFCNLVRNFLDRIVIKLKAKGYKDERYYDK